MSRQKQIRWRQLRVGAFVLISLIVLGTGIFFIAGQGDIFARHYELKLYLPSAGDLQKGAVVSLEGIPAGNVRRIAISSYSQPDRAVEIDLEISRKYQQQIRTDSVATMQTLGLLGETYVDITRGTPPHPALKEGGVLQSHSELNMKAVMKNANGALANFRGLGANLTGITGHIEHGQGSIGKMIQTHAFSDHVNKTVAGAENLANQIEEGHGTLGKFFNNEEALEEKVAAVANHLNQIVAETQNGNGTIGKLNKDRTRPNPFSRLAANAETTVKRTKGGTLAKLATDRDFHGRIRATEKNLDIITERISQGKGTIGQLSSNPQFLQSVNSSVNSLKDFLTQFRKHPRKYMVVRFHIF